MKIASMFLRILAVLGALAAAVMFYIIGNEKQELQNALSNTQNSLSQTEGRLNIVQQERDEVQTQAADLQNNLENEQARSRNLDNQLTQVRRELAQAQAQITTHTREAETLRAEANRIRRELLEERTRIEQLTDNLDQADAPALQRSIRALEQQLLETERRLQNIDETQPTGVASAERQPARREAVRGRVTEVGPDSAFILIDLGSADGVRQNAPVMIRRGPRFIGRANVTEVHEEVSVARVSPGAGEIESGDVAITLN